MTEHVAVSAQTTSPARPRIVIGDFIEPFVRGRLRRHEIVPLTARNERCHLRSFADANPAIPVAKLDVRHVRRWLESIQHLAPNTRRRRFSTVHLFCAELVHDGYLTRDPTVKVRAPRIPRTVPRALAAADVARVLAACPDVRARLIVMLMVQLGLRCGEVAALERGDIDWARGLVKVTGKGSHERILPLVDEVRSVLGEYLVVYPGAGGRLIRSHGRGRVGDGLDADTISGLVARVMWAAGVKRGRRDGVSAHALRHTMATDALRAGAHLRDIQFALGHAHLVTTEVYLPYVVHDLGEAMGGRAYGHLARDGSGVAPPVVSGAVSGGVSPGPGPDHPTDRPNDPSAR